MTHDSDTLAPPPADWAAQLLTFWFDAHGKDDWYGGGADFDAEVRTLAEGWHEALRAQPAASFLTDPDTALAATILFDQVPRNLFRRHADAFATDDLARAIARGIVQKGWDRDWSDDRRQFAYLPFEHERGCRRSARIAAADGQLADGLRRLCRTAFRRSSTALAASRTATPRSVAPPVPRRKRRWRKARIGDRASASFPRSAVMEFTDTLTDKHVAFIEKQPVFFTATAAADARINLSPKGYADSFKILSQAQVAYLDLGGSGNETHAHLAADGRITACSAPSTAAR